MDENTQIERVALDKPKRYRFIIKDSTESLPGKGDVIRFILISICGVDSLVAANALRELTKKKETVVGTYSKQVANTMKRRSDEYLSDSENRRFGIETAIEQE